MLLQRAVETKIIKLRFNRFYVWGSSLKFQVQLQVRHTNNKSTCIRRQRIDTNTTKLYNDMYAYRRST